MGTIELAELLASRLWRRMLESAAFGDSLSESDLYKLIQEALDANAQGTSD